MDGRGLKITADAIVLLGAGLLQDPVEQDSGVAALLHLATVTPVSIDFDYRPVNMRLRVNRYRTTG